MKNRTILILVIIFLLNSCGKKTYLEKYDDSNYPTQYPVN